MSYNDNEPPRLRKRLESSYDEIVIYDWDGKYPEQQRTAEDADKNSIIPFITKYFKSGDRLFSLNLGVVIYREIVKDNPTRKRAMVGYPEKMKMDYLREHTYETIKVETLDGRVVYFNSDGSINTSGICLLYPLGFMDKLSFPKWNDSMFEKAVQPSQPVKKVRRI